jgi:hypothetical protein
VNNLGKELINYLDNLKICYICKCYTPNLLKHHINYRENTIIKICHSCHSKIHLSTDPKYDKFRPKDYDTSHPKSWCKICFKYHGYVGEYHQYASWMSNPEHILFAEVITACWVCGRIKPCPRPREGDKLRFICHECLSKGSVVNNE